jgi:hypothetical protein
VLLILNRAKAVLALRRALCAGAALMLPAITLVPATPAYADKLIVSGCAGLLWRTHSCVMRMGPAGDPYVRLVPAPESQDGQARSAERDRRWQDRCRPVIVQDRYGVPRYQYAARGCEFGVIE